MLNNLIQQLSNEVTTTTNASSSTTSTIELPTYLIVLICILVAVAIIACIYKIFAYRRVSIASKKIDYLVEDLIYKSEFIMPSIEVIKNLTSYSNWADFIKNKEKLNANSKSKDNSDLKKSKKVNYEEVINELDKSKNKKANNK